MKVTVTQNFATRSALRELAVCYSRGQLSKQDYESHRSQLIDHLSGIPVQLDPFLQMLLKKRSGASVDIADVTEPQDGDLPRAEITAAPARGHEEEADLSDITHVMGRVIAAPGTLASIEPESSIDKKSSTALLPRLGIVLLVVVVIVGVLTALK